MFITVLNSFFLLGDGGMTDKLHSLIDSMYLMFVIFRFLKKL